MHIGENFSVIIRPQEYLKFKFWLGITVRKCKLISLAESFTYAWDRQELKKNGQL